MNEMHASNVLFVSIGWAEKYDGTEQPISNSRWHRNYADEYGSSEDQLYVPNQNGFHQGGAGNGKLPRGMLDIVFVAPKQGEGHFCVALFRQAGWEMDENGFARVWSNDVTLYTGAKREQVLWPSGMGMRRWAFCSENRMVWPELASFYRKLVKATPPSAASKKSLLLSPPAEREYVLRTLNQAKRDEQLRPIILAKWGPVCAVCGVTLEIDGSYECEVAHVQEVHDNGSDALTNALPLCRSHHWSFDAHGWAIHPKKRRIFVRGDLRSRPTLEGIHGRRIEPEGVRLDDAVLEWRWRRFIAAAHLSGKPPSIRQRG